MCTIWRESFTGNEIGLPFEWTFLNDARFNMDQDMESAGSKLPSEIIFFQILPRLPSKSLMRFKCVHESWSSLVCNPFFVDAPSTLTPYKAHSPPPHQLRQSQKATTLPLQNQPTRKSNSRHAPLNLPTLSYDRLYNAESINGTKRNMESSSELPSEIICFQILPRLPSKSLMRFKCVCKSWSSLVQNPSFADAHQSLHRNKLTHLLLTIWDTATRQQHFLSVQINQDGSPTPAIHLLNLPTMSNDHRLYNAQSTNGLVCLYLSNTLSRDHTLAYLDPPNFIFNPCTRESIILPHASPAYCTSHVTYHFGFSPLTNEYKVLQVQTFRPHDSIPTDLTFMFKIFKLGTSLWRRLEVDLNHLAFDPLECPFKVQGVCINGAIHWMHWKENVVVFDIGDEKFRVIPLP
ncbi:hypothetical protein DVH24_005991 [Malus domestica]|uniref:F-box domain-containing protein n=1 Tax=Malus domestica TaxID=3750 RepID=A0A498IJJ4_MALDO|nr:hypothetical protein DVH24_005991 [Malus domestica]